MLARAARPRLRPDTFRQSHAPVAEQLAVPWLCPAHMRWTPRMTSTKAPLSCDSRRLYPRTQSALSPRHGTRCLATTTDTWPAATGALPFQDFGQAWTSRRPDPDISKLPLWDVSQPLVVREALATNAIPLTINKYGVGGDPVELHQNLYACLKVGRMERASAILQRLMDIYQPSAPELVDACSIFIQALFDSAVQNPGENSMSDIEAWYQSKMVLKGIQPNAQIIVTLLRSSMHFLEDGEQEEAIRKYVALASGYGPAVLEEVNSSPEFSDDEWDTLISFQSEAFDELPALEGATGATTMAGSAPQSRPLTVNPVPQKGHGLKTLIDSLAVLAPGADIPYPHEMAGSKEEKDRAFAYMRQIRMEEDALSAAKERWKAEDAKLQEMGIHGVLQSKPLQALMWSWYEDLVPRLEEEIKATKEVLANPCPANMRDERHIYGPYIEGMSAEKLAGLTVCRVLAGSARSGFKEGQFLKLTNLALQLGTDVENDHVGVAKVRHEAALKKKRKQARREVLAQLTKQNEAPTSTDAHPPDTSSNSFEQMSFPRHIKLRLGATLVDHLLQTATITVIREDPKTGEKLSRTQPAFLHQTCVLRGKRLAVIGAHHEISKKLRTESVHSIDPVRLPMLAQPKPWTGFTDGGYYTVPLEVVRTKSDSSQKAYAITAIENGDMKKVLAGVDTLGKVPWRINRDVFTVMAESWNTGEGIGKLVPENPDVLRPVEPPADATFNERLTFEKHMKQYENDKNGYHSQRCFQNFQLEVARAFLDETMYFPHSLDFRGRAYPIPPILNHLGADPARGLLMFANGKELGDVGLKWLKIHLANLYGYDKANLKDRENFATENMDEIYDSANNPLGGNRWWTKAEDPWQCLACCVELKNALESPDPRRFVSHLPVHQDGTCNGLQHYAALGGDEAGATQVNLEPSDKPQDIYSGVAELVRSMVAEDAEHAVPNPVAVFMNGHVSRSLVKRTVMTNVYGVTFMGAKLQVLDELKQMFPNFRGQDGVSDLNFPATYIARKIFTALGQIFNGAQEIQCWLGECGDRITTSISAEQIRNIKARFDGKELGYDSKYKQPEKLSARSHNKIYKETEMLKTSIIWTTPLRMPVIQPYRKHNVRNVLTKVSTVSLSSQSGNEEINRAKQLQAFPPNFIHSLDASHMTLSALKCAELGLDFASVHDSFWTHAADIPTLNVVLRDAFVRMHSEDIIGRLAAEFEARYAGAMYQATLVGTSRAAQEIAKWRSLKSGRKIPGTGSKRTAIIQEVALEAERQELLKSEDPDERERGRKMVTPTSIWLKYRDPLALKSNRLKLLGELQSARSAAKASMLKDKILSAEAESVGAAVASAPEADAVEEAVASTTDDAVDVVDDVADMEEDVEEDMEDGDEDAQEGSGSHSSGTARDIRVWLPLTFPPTPKKGSWDVSRLKESEYFFS